MPTVPHILTLSCPDRPGIVNAVTSLLLANGGNVTEAQQFGDVETVQFFMRAGFTVDDDRADTLRDELTRLAQPLGMQWQLRRRDRLRPVMLLVSRFDHCLADVLYRWRTGELPMTVTAVVSNHPRALYRHLDLDGIPFHHLPVDDASRAAQETALESLIDNTDTELVVLARYMQVLSPQLAARLHGRCVNIHHSFLPGFKGARPYHQAHARGVKLIGATAHFVTADLDDGPIIEQDTQRVGHQHTTADLVRIGRDIERRVLVQALHYLLEDRVFLNGHKTVVFSA